MNYGGTKRGKHDYLRSCSYCGRLVLRSTMVKKDGFLACKDDARGREPVTLDRLNAANLKPRRWSPARDRLSDRDNEQDIYQADESVTFNLMVTRPGVTNPTNNGKGPESSAFLDTQKLGDICKYLGSVIVENKRPTAWISSATAALRVNANLILTKTSTLGDQDGSPFFGSVTRQTASQIYEVATAGSAGYALLVAYQILGDKKYLIAARAIAHFVRVMQFSAWASVAWTSADTAGTSHLYTGFWSHSIEATQTNIDPPAYGRYDHLFYPSDLNVLDFLRLLLKVDGDATYGSTTTVNTFFTRAPAALLSQMIADAMLMWDNGLFDATVGTVIEGLSAATPKERFNAFPGNKQSPVFTGPGSGSWETPIGTITTLNWAMGIRAIYNNEGLSARVLSLWNVLTTTTQNPPFATPANTGDFIIARGDRGPFDPTLVPSKAFNAANRQTSSPQYDWASWGLLSPIQAAKSVTQFLTARVALGLKRYRTADPGGSDATDYIGYYGASGFSFQTFNQRGNTDLGLAAYVNDNYRMGPILFPMADRS